MSKEFYMGDNFNRGYSEREDIGSWNAMACCNSVSASPSRYIATNAEDLRDAIKALSKPMENIKFSAKDAGDAFKKISDRLKGGRRSLRNELKTLGGNGRYV